MVHAHDLMRTPFGFPHPSPVDTAEFSHEEILQRLEMGRLIVKSTEEGSRLEVSSVAAFSDQMDRRRFQPLNIPTLFPESGAILVLLVGGFADDAALKCSTPFWQDGAPGSAFIWQAMSRACLVHRKDTDLKSPLPPRTQGVAMTYAGFRRKGENLDFERVIHPWNLHRLQTLIQACWDRSMDRLKIITMGEAARFMMCSCVYGMPGIPILSMPEPIVSKQRAPISDWVEWATNLMEIAKSPENS